METVKRIELEFKESKLKVISHSNQYGHKYYSIHMCEYDTELLYPEEGMESEKKVILEAASYYSKDDVKKIIQSLQQAIEEPSQTAATVYEGKINIHSDINYQELYQLLGQRTKPYESKEETVAKKEVRNVSENKKAPQTAATVSEEVICLSSDYSITKKGWNELFSDLPSGNLKDGPEKIKPCIASKEFDLDEC